MKQRANEYKLKRPDSKCLKSISKYESKYLSGEMSANDVAKKTGYSRAKVRSHFNHNGVFAPLNKRVIERQEPFHTPLFLFNRRLSHGLNGL